MKNRPRVESRHREIESTPQRRNDRRSQNTIPINWKLVAVGNPAAREVVAGHFDLDFIAHYNADIIPPHLAGQVRQQDMTVFELNPESRVRQGFNDFAVYRKGFFFRHTVHPCAANGDHCPQRRRQRSEHYTPKRKSYNC